MSLIGKGGWVAVEVAVTVIMGWRESICAVLRVLLVFDVEWGVRFCLLVC